MTRKAETESEGPIISRDRLDKLKQRQAALEIELQGIQERLAGAERRAQDREKVLLGVGVQEALKASLLGRDAMVRLLDLLTAGDRAWMVARGWGPDGEAGKPKAAKAAAKTAGAAPAA